ncbi:MAG: HD domain-containing phosphohydrolase [Candidatus Omnitrophota bacterium]|jgi:putative two-component system response regulator
MTRPYISKYIEDTYIEMILRFAIAAEYKDNEIGSHIIRVSDYSTAIARALNFSSKKLKIIRFASIMHDIGKIGVSSLILHKKDITAQDYDKIKEHTRIGGRIFAGSLSPVLQAAGEIALYHHEWFNGGGYPFGLRSKQIPLYARIVTLADAFDAIVSERPYKKSETMDYAVEAINKRSGSQFDPGIVDAFIRIIPSMKDILKAANTIDNFLKENKRFLKAL